MSFKTTGILAFLLVLLGGYLYLFEIRGQEERERAHERSKKVAPVEKDRVARLRLETPDEKISAMKEGFVWRITSPVEAMGDYETIEGLLVASNGLEKVGVAADSAQISLPDFSLADFGLADPAIRLSFEGEGDSPQEIIFGDRSPTGVYLYVQVSGDDKVYLAKSMNYHLFDLALHDLRDKRYVRFDPDLVASIELQYGGLRIAVERDGLQWKMNIPVEDRGDDSSIARFLTDLRDARIENFASLKVGESTGLEEPWFSITMTEGPDRKKNGIAFGRKAGSRAYRKYLAKAEGNPHVFEADSLFVHHMLESGANFRNKDIFTFARHEADHVEIVYPDSALIFKRHGYNEWEVVSPESHTILGRRVEDFLDEIYALRAITYVSEGMGVDGRAVFETKGIRIRLLREGQLLREIIVGAVDKHLYAATNDRKQIVEIDRSFLSQIRDVRISPKNSLSQG
jgi:hypothetical protein